MSEESSGGTLGALSSYAAYVATLGLRERRGLSITDDQMALAFEMLDDLKHHGPVAAQQAEVLLALLGSRD